ncbi:Hypp6551 [Branchiostoma lanceolatum]|uniref:Hypp6551 protein n=1 Tax=Branchiostoma lanceolatum TaxID=7740 RepID=A0A8J9YV52_BRALA|nr:Hypp6551 [Branchiostoma lanceolatum]
MSPPTETQVHVSNIRGEQFIVRAKVAEPRTPDLSGRGQVVAHDGSRCNHLETNGGDRHQDLGGGPTTGVPTNTTDDQRPTTMTIALINTMGISSSYRTAWTFPSEFAESQRLNLLLNSEELGFVNLTPTTKRRVWDYGCVFFAGGGKGDTERLRVKLQEKDQRILELEARPDDNINVDEPPRKKARHPMYDPKFPWSTLAPSTIRGKKAEHTGKFKCRHVFFNTSFSTSYSCPHVGRGREFSGTTEARVGITEPTPAHGVAGTARHRHPPARHARIVTVTAATALTPTQGSKQRLACRGARRSTDTADNTAPIIDLKKRLDKDTYQMLYRPGDHIILPWLRSIKKKGYKERRSYIRNEVRGNRIVDMQKMEELMNLFNTGHRKANGRRVCKGDCKFSSKLEKKIGFGCKEALLCKACGYKTTPAELFQRADHPRPASRQTQHPGRHSRGQGQKKLNVASKAYVELNEKQMEANSKTLAEVKWLRLDAGLKERRTVTVESDVGYNHPPKESPWDSREHRRNLQLRNGNVSRAHPRKPPPPRSRNPRRRLGNLALTEADSKALQAFIDYRLGPETAKRQRMLLTTNKSEAFHNRVLKAVPKAMTFKKNYKGRVHAAALADSVGSGAAIRRANEFLGASHFQGSPGKAALEAMDREDDYHRKRRKTWTYRLKRYHLRQAKAEKRDKKGDGTPELEKHVPLLGDRWKILDGGGGVLSGERCGWTPPPD